MRRLVASPDPALWIPVTGSFGLRGRRARKKAIGMLLSQAMRGVTPGAGLGEIDGAGAGPAPGRAPGGVAAWALSQAAPMLMRRLEGRVLAYIWKDDPALVVALATVIDATNDMRVAQAMSDDEGEDFRSPHLGTGEKFVRTDPGAATATITYLWDTGSQFVSLSAIAGDALRVGTIVRALDDLARTVRLVDDLAVGEAGAVVRLDP
ncbi:MAG TPA: hypothetical protein PKH61_00380 [Microbacteriaceae bacterium]|jgi:hypothetical protein|nr:hypothetical protein [Microbacteriaceae bacterium]HPZ34289.1 hypothetical protein [Microbacteriaceae bacterium]HQC92651.1 hypothetical protein [Microbacteriaceae bacterium]